MKPRRFPANDPREWAPALRRWQKHPQISQISQIESAKSAKSADASLCRHQSENDDCKRLGR